jgi:hypothetical protein
MRLLNYPSGVRQLAHALGCSANSIYKSARSGCIGDKVGAKWVISQEDALWFRYHVVMAPMHAAFNGLVELITSAGPVTMIAGPNGRLTPVDFKPTAMDHARIQAERGPLKHYETSDQENRAR